MVRVDLSTTPPTRSTYALFPDLKPAPNFLSFDLDGTAYVTDTTQAVIWKVPSGGGAPQIWFADHRLDSGLGPNGAALDTIGRRIYFTSSPQPTEGAVWSLPLVPRPEVSDLQRFHTFSGVPVSIPDGLAIGERGLYVALPSQQASSSSTHRVRRSTGSS